MTPQHPLDNVTCKTGPLSTRISLYNGFLAQQLLPTQLFTTGLLYDRIIEVSIYTSPASVKKEKSAL